MKYNLVFIRFIPRNTGHLSQTDFAHITPSILAKYNRSFGITPAITINAVNNKLCFDFLEMQLGKLSFISAGYLL